MLGRLRRRVVEEWSRVRGSARYWWLEQSARAGRYRRGRRARFGRAGSVTGDRWFDLAYGARRRVRHIRWAVEQGARRLLASLALLPRRLRGWSVAHQKASVRRLRLARAGVTDALVVRPRAAAGWVTGAPAALRVALVVGVVLVVSGVTAAAFRLPAERPSDDLGPARSDTDDQDKVRKGGGRSAGPGLTEPGIHLLVSPVASGDLEVVERVITPDPISVLPLAVPSRLPGVDGAVPRLVDLRIVADDAAVLLDASAEVEPRRDVELLRPATTLELRYRVLGADQQSLAAPPGRASLSLRPAASTALASLRTVVEVRGAVVHAMVCLDVHRKRQLCGIEGRTGWRTRPVPADRASVLALVDLPAPDA